MMIEITQLYQCLSLLNMHLYPIDFPLAIILANLFLGEKPAQSKTIPLGHFFVLKGKIKTDRMPIFFSLKPCPKRF